MLVPSSAIRAAIVGLTNVGMDGDALLEASGLRREQLEAPFAMAPVAAIEAVWACAASLDPRPELVLRAGRALPLGQMRLLDTLAISAPTLRAVLDDSVRFFRFASVTLALSVRVPERGTLHDVAVDIRTVAPLPRLPIGESWAMAVFLSRLRAGVPDLTLTAAVVPPSVGRDLDGCADALGIDRRRITISDRHSGFSFAARWLDVPIQSADPGLYALISSTADQIFSDAYGQTPLTFAIRQALTDALADGAFRADDISQRLGLSTRSLQRHLAAEGTSYRAVLDAHRHELACRRLARPACSVGEVASALGYTDPAAFSRAFQRWEGVAPSVWRKANGSPA